MRKYKTCRGINKAKGYDGCGKKVIAASRRYGLCRDCFRKWLLDTEDGKEVINKSVLKGKKAEKKRKRKENKKAKIDLMTSDNYRARYVQPVINKIARLIDYEQPCIATGNYKGKMAGGHYISVGSNRTTALNLHNIHKQSFHSNSWKGGDEIRYRQGIINNYGEDYLEFMESMRKIKPIKLNKEELYKVKIIANRIRKELEINPKRLTPKERISKRNEVNVRLGIYDRQKSFFKIN